MSESPAGSPRDCLARGAAALGLELDGAQLGALARYIDAVLECNKGYNLMKAADAGELAVNHVLDSLAGAPHIARLAASLRKTEAAAVELGDIGSGGGCPGIPLAIALPDMHVSLVERMERRCVFLEQTVRSLGLSNVSVLCTQADKVPRASFDIATFRAFHPFDKKILAMLFAMLKKGGRIVAYKARAEKIAAEMAGVKDIVPSYTKIALTVPFLEDHERNLVII